MSKHYINGHVLALGSVSSGTLRTEDLIAAFAAELRRFHATSPQIAIEADGWLAGPEAYAEDYEGDYTECGEGVLADLGFALNEIAPAGVRFGAHEGGGADFGWWEEENE